MPLAHFDNLFTFAAAGLGLLLAGGLNLAFGQGGRRAWLRFAVTLVMCFAILGGLLAFTRQELAVRAASVVFGVLSVATLLGSSWFTRQLTSLIGFFRKPVARWGTVALGGLGLIVGAGIAFESADEAATKLELHSLELTVGRVDTRPTERGHATTDHGNQIVLKEPVQTRNPSEIAENEAKALRDMKYGDQVIRRSGPYDDTNCHGWVFTAGKFLLSPDDVELILKENGYQQTNDLQPGDLVIYRQGGVIAHSAVVRYTTEGQPVLIEGKWGAMGVFIHPVDKSPYGNEYTFHRSPRTSHLLVGLGGSPNPNPNPNAGTQSASTATE